MKEYEINLEKILAELPVNVRAETILKILQRADRNENDKEIENVEGKISSYMILECLDHHYAILESLDSDIKYNKEDVSTLLEKRDRNLYNIYLISEQGIKRKDQKIALRGAEILEEKASNISLKDKQLSKILRCKYLDWAAILYKSAYNHVQAAECYEKMESWEQAADQWAWSGYWQKASEYFEKCGKFKDAAECAETYDTDRAIGLAIRANKQSLAALIAGRAGRLKKDSERDKRYREALSYCGNDVKLKVEIAEMMRNYEDAVNFYEQEGMLAEAAKMAKEHDDIESANRLYEDLIKLHLKNRDFKTARDFALEAEKYDYIAKIDEHNGHIMSAAYYWGKVGNKNRKKLLLERALKEGMQEGNFSLAREAAGNLGDTKKVEELDYLDRITRK